MAPVAELAVKNQIEEVPAHVAIIMDGNGRWATREGVSRSKGHKKGSEAVREAIEGALEAGVRYLTIYAFSSENWKRSSDEVTDLMGLLRFYLSREVAKLHKENIRLNVIGHKERLDSDIRTMIENAEHQTRDNARLRLTIALSYGARDEIIEAAKALATDVCEGNKSLSDITEENFSAALYTHDIPDPDLIIRTSGEQRLSNFLLWQAAYSELLFLDVLWPDFTRAMFADALTDYTRRDRRFGARQGV